MSGSKQIGDLLRPGQQVPHPYAGGSFPFVPFLVFVFLFVWKRKGFYRKGRKGRLEATYGQKTTSSPISWSNH